MLKKCKDIALLEYKFIFDPNKTWGRLSEFEADLAAVFRLSGLDVELVNNANDESERILYIYPKDKMEPVLNEPLTKGVGYDPKKIISKLKVK